MNLAAFNDYCASLPQTTSVVQWGGAHVWKVGGKVFTIAGWSGKEEPADPFITFKCSEISYDILKEQDGMRPAPYLASRGMKWIQVMDHTTLGEQGLKDYIKASYEMVIGNLTKKKRADLGLN